MLNEINFHPYLYRNMDVINAIRLVIYIFYFEKLISLFLRQKLGHCFRFREKGRSNFDKIGSRHDFGFDLSEKKELSCQEKFIMWFRKLQTRNHQNTPVRTNKFYNIFTQYYKRS